MNMFDERYWDATPCKHCDQPSCEAGDDCTNCDTCGAWFDIETGGHYELESSVGMCAACCGTHGWYTYGVCRSC